ncbi:MAG: SRPBCC family protein, partial [Methylobacteriaceae bacterium]|nr:SRPBCC family protein [Methylobacteriaceae bacterium]
MAGTLPSRQLCVTIERPPGEVYDFASLPENFPKWAAGLGNSVTRAAGGWIAQTAQGPLRVRFTERNAFGVLDHYVRPARGDEIYVPVRVIANGSGTEVLFTLFRLPGMSDAQ